MRDAGAHEEAIRTFESAYRRLDSGQTAMLPSAELEPAGDVPALDALPDADASSALEGVVVIKLNGGLATTMGLQQPKSLIEARDGRSFLDIIIGQTVALRPRCRGRLPLVLMISEEIPFLLEVVEGTEADRKGGHIARRRADGQLVLRETAQTPSEDEESFRDFRRWRYYNTNNLWIDLRVLDQTLEQAAGVLELPLIVNRKTVDPRNSDST